MDERTMFVAELTSIQQRPHLDVLLTFQKYGTHEIFTVTAEPSKAWTVNTLYVVSKHYAHKLTYGDGLHGNWKQVTHPS